MRLVSAALREHFAHKPAEALRLIEDQRHRQCARRKRSDGFIAGEPRQILLRRQQQQVAAFGLFDQRRSLGRRIAVVIGIAALDRRGDPGRVERRKEFFRIADAGKGENPVPRERGECRRVRRKAAVK